MSATTKTTTKTTTKNTICQHCGKEFARIWQHRCKQIKTETNVTLSIEENKNENQIINTASNLIKPKQNRRTQNKFKITINDKIKIMKDNMQELKFIPIKCDFKNCDFKCKIITEMWEHEKTHQQIKQNFDNIFDFGDLEFEQNNTENPFINSLSNQFNLQTIEEDFNETVCDIQIEQNIKEEEEPKRQIQNDQSTEQMNFNQYLEQVFNDQSYGYSDSDSDSDNSDMSQEIDYINELTNEQLGQICKQELNQMSLITNIKSNQLIAEQMQQQKSQNNKLLSKVFDKDIHDDDVSSINSDDDNLDDSFEQKYQQELLQEQQQEQLEEQLEQRRQELEEQLEKKIRQYQNNCHYDYLYINKGATYNKSKYALEKIQSSDHEYLGIIRVDQITKKTIHWHKVYAIQKLGWFHKQDISEFNYHQIIYKQHNIKFYFDVDDLPEDIDIKNFEINFTNAIYSILKQWYNLLESQYSIIFQYNSLKTGCHVYINGLKTNLFIAQQFCKEIINQHPEFKQHLDMAKYNLGTSLRILGKKSYEKQNNEYYLNNDMIKYIICYTNESDLFVGYPSLQKRLYIDSMLPKQIKNNNIELEDISITQERINQWCDSKNIQRFIIIQNNDYIIAKPHSLNCLVCKKTHNKLHDLKFISSKQKLTMNCFSNIRKNNENQPILIWKEQDKEQIQLNQLKNLGINIPLDQIQEYQNIEQQQNNLIPDQYKFEFPETEKSRKENGDIYIPEQQLIQYINQNQDIAIYSQLGTGKTKIIEQMIQNINGAIILISSRVSFSQSISKRLGFELYNQFSKQIKLDSHSRFIIQLESIDRLDFTRIKPQLLILDEFSSLINHFVSAQYLSHYGTQQFIDIIQQSSQLVICDAHLMQNHIDLYNCLRHEYNPKTRNEKILPIKIISNHYQPGINNQISCNFQFSIPKNYEQIICENIKQKLAQGIKIAVHSTKRNIIKKIAESLIQNNICFKDDICIIHGKNDDQGFHDQNKFHIEEKQIIYDSDQLIELNKYKIVLYSQTITFGLSMENHNEFQHLEVLLDWKTSNGSSEAMQSLMRFRNIKTINIYSRGEINPKKTVFENFQQIIDYCNYIQLKHISPEKSAMYNLHVHSLNCQTYWLQNPNQRLIQLMQMQGIKVYYNFISNTTKTFKSSKTKQENFEFGKYQIGINDIYYYINRQDMQPNSNFTSPLTHENIQQTLYWCEKLLHLNEDSTHTMNIDDIFNCFELTNQINIDDDIYKNYVKLDINDKNIFINTSNLERLNNIIQSQKKQVQEQINKVPKCVHKLLLTANKLFDYKKRQGQIIDTYFNSVEYLQNLSDLYQLYIQYNTHFENAINMDKNKKLQLILKTYQIIEKEKDINQIHDNVAEIIKQYYKFNNKKQNISPYQFIINKTPFRIFQNIQSSGTEQISIQNLQYMQKNNLDTDHLFYAVSDLSLEILHCISNCDQSIFNKSMFYPEMVSIKEQRNNRKNIARRKNKN